MSIVDTVNSHIIGRVMDERGETLELRTPPREWPRDKRGVIIVPPVELWRPRP
jgi:hypothetical protein